ncbi:sugar phosphate isomerase/epimerase family protein [Pseudomonadota bacterium]
MSNIALANTKVDTPLIGVQLHSVKHQVDQDFSGTLRTIADMGFDGVEFAGRYGPYKDDPLALKAFLQSIGLQVSGAHTSINQLRKGSITDNLSFFQQLGVELLIVPHDDRVDDPDKVAELAKELRALTIQAKEYGIKLGYHNHAKEFKSFKDTTFWDYLAQSTPEEFVLQLDVGWANYAGADAIEYVKRYPNRTITTHYKIRNHEGLNEPVIIGNDSFDWKKLFETNITFGSTKWIIIEQEEYPLGMSTLDAVRASKAGLDLIIKSNSPQ